MGRWFRIAAAAAVNHIAAVAMHIMCGGAVAQTAFPSRPVAYFRALSRRWCGRCPDAPRSAMCLQAMGTAVVVGDRPGAGGVIASQAVATAPPAATP